MFDVIIIGAGVIGLAVAAKLGSSGRAVLVLERHGRILAETSSRNSEVVHAGFYYPSGSIKAWTCLRGRRLLVKRCEDRGIPWLPCGKAVVAQTEDELATLQGLLQRGEDNGVDGLRLIGVGELAEIEPFVSGIGALWSPGSAIIDSHRLGLSLRAEAEDHGVTFSLGARVVDADRGQSCWQLAVEQAGMTFTVEGLAVVNAAGLGQDEVSRFVGLREWPQTLVKGCWYNVRNAPPVRTLVYPVGSADRLGLGIHGCLDLSLALRLGPDARPASGPNDLDVSGDEGSFFDAGRKFFPWLRREDLSPGLAGLRPKLAGAAFRDFVVDDGSARGLPGWITLAGIESPGLTAALALAEDVETLLRG